MITRHARALCLSLLLPAFLAACSSGTTTQPSSVQVEATPIPYIFTGELQVGGSIFYSLSLVQANFVSVTLNSLTAGEFDLPVAASVGLAIGNVDESGVCVHAMEVTASPSFRSQMTQIPTQAGNKCIDIFDRGTLSGSVLFNVRIVTTIAAGKPETVTPAPGTDVFTSNLPLRTSVSHSLNASQNGTITVNLSALVPANARFGLGLGVPRADGAACNLTTYINATTGSGPITALVDRGTYCVRVFDPATLATPAAFTLTSTYP
jgi:hypothetical protein